MSSVTTIQLSLKRNNLVFDKNNKPKTVSFEIGDDEGENNVRIELSVAKVFHKVLNFIREDSEIFQKEEFELLGEILSKIIFGKHSDLRVMVLDDVLLGLKADSRNRCRILLNFDATSGMADLPWEYLLHKFRDTKESFYLSASTASRFQMVRYFPDVKPLPATAGQVLFVILLLSLDGNPNAIPRISSLITERGNIIDMIRHLAETTDKQLEFKILEDGFVEDLASGIAEIVEGWRKDFGFDPPYIVHYVGHSYFDRQTQFGKVVMKKADDGLTDWIVDADFASVFLPGRMEVPRPSAVFFHSCDSAKIGVMGGMLHGVAYECLQSGISAVVGMQNEINLHQSCAFYHEVYKNLLDGADIAESVTRGRSHLGNSTKDYMNRKLQPFGSPYKSNYFGSPVLFMSAGEPITLIQPPVRTSDQQAPDLPTNADVAAQFGFGDRARR